jgi:hypothetical protein
MTDLPTPPPEICGKLSRFAPDEIKQLRREWVKQMDAAKHLRRDIAAALGIGITSLSRVAPRPHKTRIWEKNYRAARRDNAIGSWGRGVMWESFTSEQRAALYTIAERRRCTPSDVIAGIVCGISFLTTRPRHSVICVCHPLPPSPRWHSVRRGHCCAGDTV